MKTSADGRWQRHRKLGLIACTCSRSHSVPIATLSSVGQSLFIPSQDSAASHAPPLTRHSTWPAVSSQRGRRRTCHRRPRSRRKRLHCCGRRCSPRSFIDSVSTTPSQVGHRTPSGSAGRGRSNLLSAGRLSTPSHASSESQSPTLARQTVPMALHIGGHKTLVPPGSSVSQAHAHSDTPLREATPHTAPWSRSTRPHMSLKRRGTSFGSRPALTAPHVPSSCPVSLLRQDEHKPSQEVSQRPHHP